MGAIPGVDILVKVNTGTDIAPVWTAVGGQRNATLNLDMDTIDVTSKDSNGWIERLAGYREWSIEFDALLIENDTALGKLIDAYMNRQKVQVQMALPGGTKYQGYGYFTGSFEGPYEGEATASGTITSAGELEKLTA